MKLERFDRQPSASNSDQTSLRNNRIEKHNHVASRKAKNEFIQIVRTGF